MSTILEYLNWRGDLSFSDAPFNEVDNLIFAELSFVNLAGIVPEDVTAPPVTVAEAAQAYFTQNKGKKISMGLIVPDAILTLFHRAAKTRRFQNIGMSGYTNHIDTDLQVQFAAVSFWYAEQQLYIAFRGTDDTLVGWKENLNMGLLPHVPAQKEAVAYVEQVAAALPGRLRLGGHSKGGNLAVYSAAACSPAVQDRIDRVYSNDGPGFRPEFLTSPGYLQIRDRLDTFVPQTSVVGMLMEHDASYQVVKSTEKGLYQHDGFSWEVLGNAFVHLKTVTEQCRKIDHTLRKWMQTMTEEERECFVNGLYEILSASNAKTLTELTEDKMAFLKSLRKVDAKTRKTVTKALFKLMDDATKTFLFWKKKKSAATLLPKLPPREKR